MTQIILNIQDASILPSLKRVLSAIKGVSLSEVVIESNKKGIDEALDDVKAGRVFKAENVDDLFAQIVK